jgi:hypothetical protein
MPSLEQGNFRPHALRYIVEPLMEDPSYLEKPMFGCRACYLYGRMVLVLACTGDEPWNGILLPTEKKFQPSLVDQFPALAVHPILGKWLYLREDTTEFEKTAAQLVQLILQGDARLGIIPKTKKTGRGKKRKKKHSPQPRA